MTKFDHLIYDSPSSAVGYIRENKDDIDGDKILEFAEFILERYEESSGSDIPDPRYELIINQLFTITKYCAEKSDTND